MTEKFIREEEDGTTTNVYATNCNGAYKTHNIKGPAIVNKKQGVEDYYLYGVKLSKDDWAKKAKFA